MDHRKINGVSAAHKSLSEAFSNGFSEDLSKDLSKDFSNDFPKAFSNGFPEDSSDASAGMGPRLKSFRKAAHISQQRMGDLLGVTRNTIINWEAGKYRPDLDLFAAICSILHITLYQLLGISPPEEEGMTEDEWALISQYRKISPMGRRIAGHLIRSILEEEITENDRHLESSVLMVDFISTAAAAGDGFDFSDIPVEDFRFIFRNDLNEKANAIIRVKGDSMLPVYKDSDYVYIQYTNSAVIGEDILCTSFAGAHIKRLGENGPYSLNKSLPFRLTSPDDHVEIRGRVLGIVSSRDYPTPQELTALQEIKYKEIQNFRKLHGIENN